MDVYQKPETDIVLCTEQDSLLQLKLSRTRMVVEPGNAVDPWDTNAGLSDFNNISPLTSYLLPLTSHLSPLTSHLSLIPP